MFIVPVHGEPHEIDVFGLSGMQRAVGGYIETLQLFTGRFGHVFQIGKIHIQRLVCIIHLLAVKNAHHVCLVVVFH